MDLEAPAGLERKAGRNPEDSEARDYLVLREGEALFGIPIEEVREVLRVPAGSGGESSIRYQGGEIDLIDFAPGSVEVERTEGPPRLVVLRLDPPVAILIPQVVGIRALREEGISSTVRFPVAGPVGGSLTGVVRVEGEMIFIIDAHRFVAATRGARP